MAKNYEIINYIRGQMKDFDVHFINAVVKAFNKMYDSHEPNGCMSTSTQLLVCARWFGYDAELCYGLCRHAEFEFYHAWLEIGGSVFDIAIYGNANFSPLYMGSKLTLPIINEKYDRTPIKYGKFVFDNDWNGAQIKMATNQTLESYFDKSPRRILWQFTCSLLDISPTSDNIIKLRNIAKEIMIESRE